MIQLWTQEKKKDVHSGSAGSILFSWSGTHGRTTLNSALLSVNLNPFQVVSHSDDFQAISETIKHVWPLPLITFDWEKKLIIYIIHTKNLY